MQNIKLGFILVGCLIAVPVNATSTKTIRGENGQTIEVRDYSGQNILSVDCGNISAGVTANKAEGDAPSIRAEMGLPLGFKRLPSVAKPKLTAEHEIANMRIGCLTRNGGVGIEIPHTVDPSLAVKIQIDENGRVFLGYDKAGLELTNIQKNEND